MKGLDVDRLKDVVMSEDGSRTKIVFEQDGADFYFNVATDELRATMPILSMATNPAGPEVTTITITEVEAHLDRAGEFLLTLVNTAGARMTFGLSRPLTLELSALADEALQSQSGSSTAH